MSDEEIITSYKNGNLNAFKDLIDKYTPSIYNFIARLTNKNDAPDLVQEIFIKAWKNIGRFNPNKASFKTWIFTIARNTVTDFLRKSGSASGGKKSINFSDLDTKEESFSENIPDENLLPDKVLEKLEDSEILNKTLEKLSKNYQEILILHYQEEMTFEEIGKILSKPLNTVKSSHRRAILELRKILAPK